MLTSILFEFLDTSEDGQLDIQELGTLMKSAEIADGHGFQNIKGLASQQQFFDSKARFSSFGKYVNDKGDELDMPLFRKAKLEKNSMTLRGGDFADKKY